jgi:hypothetical protein
MGRRVCRHPLAERDRERRLVEAALAALACPPLEPEVCEVTCIVESRDSKLDGFVDSNELSLRDLLRDSATDVPSRGVANGADGTGPHLARRHALVPRCGP